MAGAGFDLHFGSAWPSQILRRLRRFFAAPETKSSRCGASSSQSRNRALAYVVAAREIRGRRALRRSPAGLGLLRRRQFRRPAHVLPALLHVINQRC